MKEIIAGVAKTYSAEIVFNYKDGYPPTINHKKQSENVLEAAKKVVGEKAGPPYLSMGGEDFSYYLQKIPGCFFLLDLLLIKRNYLRHLIIVRILIWMRELYW